MEQRHLYRNKAVVSLLLFVSSVACFTVGCFRQLFEDRIMHGYTMLIIALMLIWSIALSIRYLYILKTGREPLETRLWRWMWSVKSRVFPLIVFVAIVCVIVVGITLVIPITLFIIADDAVGVQLHRVMDTTVIREIRHGDHPRDQDSPQYAISFEVPQSWVYTVRTNQNGPTLLFEYLNTQQNHAVVNEEIATPIFFVTALEPSVYYKQRTKGDWWDGVVARTTDTYFVIRSYDMPHNMATDAPNILATIQIIPLD